MPEKRFINFYRKSVGIFLLNARGDVWVGRRSTKDDYWQMPQGGIDSGETLEQAFYREIQEELGLAPADLKIIKIHDQWLRYDFPEKFIWFSESEKKHRCIGQQQRWILCLLLSDDACVNLRHTSPVEFISWCWQPVDVLPQLVIEFKRDVYRQLITDFRPWIDNLKRV